MSVMKDAIAIVRSFSRLHNELCMFSLSPITAASATFSKQVWITSVALGAFSTWP